LAKSKRTDLNGHLIIHHVTLEQAKGIMDFLKFSFPELKADWWSNEEMAKEDDAAAFAIFTHDFPSPKKPVKLGQASPESEQT